MTLVPTDQSKDRVENMKNYGIRWEILLDQQEYKENMKNYGIRWEKMKNYGIRWEILLDQQAITQMIMIIHEIQI